MPLATATRSASEQRTQPTLTILRSSTELAPSVAESLIHATIGALRFSHMACHSSAHYLYRLVDAAHAYIYRIGAEQLFDSEELELVCKCRDTFYGDWWQSAAYDYTRAYVPPAQLATKDPRMVALILLEKLQQLTAPATDTVLIAA